MSARLLGGKAVADRLIEPEGGRLARDQRARTGEDTG